MKHSCWGRPLLHMLGIVLCTATAAHAAPERLNDDVPDAFPDQANALSFSYSHEALKLEGPLNDDSIAHDYFKLRYTINPKTALAFRYGGHNLNGGLGLVNPLFDNRDKGQSFMFDIGLNLLNVAAVPADPDNEKEFEAGSAFGVGVSGTLYQMDMGDLNSEDSMLRAYLVYTTDLSPEMRAHTIFTTSRLSGDSTSGSVNRVGAGLDYTLINGEHPLTLMANGILDVYNFREPDFNTSRISRFDVGLRYRVASDWYASLGYTTHNDSENDASGSGIFASVQYVDEPDACVTCEPLVEENLPESEVTATALESVVQGDEKVQPTQDAVFAQPPLMRSTEIQPAKADVPVPGFRSAASQPVTDAIDGESEPVSDPVDDALNTDSDEPELEVGEAELTAHSVGSQEDGGATGVIIPELPEDRPRHTAAGAVMVRTGAPLPAGNPRHTSANDVMLRTPVGPSTDGTLGNLIASELESDAPGDQQTLIAMNSAAVDAESDESADTAETDDTQDGSSQTATDKTASTAGG